MLRLAAESFAYEGLGDFISAVGVNEFGKLRLPGVLWQPVVHLAAGRTVQRKRYRWQSFQNDH